MGNGVSVEYSSVTDALLAGKTQQEIEVYLAQVQNYQPQQIGDLLEGTNQNDLSDSNLHPWHSIMSLSPTIQLQKLRAGVHTENILKLDKLNLKKLDDIDINVEVSKLIDLRFKAEPSLTGLCLQSFDGLEKFVLSMQLSRQLLFLDLSDNDDLSYVSFSQIVSKLNNSNHSITNKLNKNSSSRTDINNHDTDDDSADCRDNQEVIVLDADAAAETTQMKLERQSPAADVENFKSENLNPSSQDLENLITVDGAWLLELSLAGLQAQALPYGVSEWKPLCHLLIMDLSFINDLDITRINWKALQVLIKLSMEDCDLNTLNLDNFRIHSLLCLNVAENRFNSTDDLLPVKMMPYLQELDTRNNEISSGGTTATREVYVCAHVFFILT